MFRKNKLAMIVGEFLGTGALTLTVLSLKYSQVGVAYFVAIAAGLTMVALTLALAGISGAVFNPAITIGLWTVRKLRTVQAIVYLAAQLLGGAVAYLLFVYLTKLTNLHNSGHYESRVLVAEVVGTFVFAFAWASGTYQRFTLQGQAAARGIGLAVGSIIASLGLAGAAGLLNPAVALGARNWGWLTTVLGPILGAIVGFNLYNLLFVETEVAEVEEAAEEVAALAAASAAVDAAAVKPATRGTAARKTATRKTPAKKPAARRTGTSGRRSSRS